MRPDAPRPASPQPVSALRAGPDDQIDGMSRYWVQALGRGMSHISEAFADVQGAATTDDYAVAVGRMERADDMFRQLVADALREAFFRGGAWGMAHNTTRYLVVTQQEKERLEKEGTVV